MQWKTVFHERINELWERAKDKDYRLTLESYAKHLDTTRSSLRGWLAGKGQPDADGFVRVAVREKVSLKWLLGDDREIDGCSEQEVAFVQKFRTLSKIHQEDIRVFVEHYYNQDHPPSSSAEEKDIPPKN